MANVAIARNSSAPPEAVFEVLTDHGAYPDFTPIRRVELERSGEQAPNGVGAIRALHVVGPPLREEVLEYEPPRRFAYRLLSGLPVRNHVGTVTIEPRDGGSRIVYAIDSSPTLPGTGLLLAGGAKVAIGRLLDCVVAEAERRRARG